MQERRNDFEDRYFNALDENFKDIRSDIREVKDETKEIIKHVQRINGRLGKVENKVFPEKQDTIQQLPPFWRDPQILKVITIVGIGVILALIIFAGLKGIPLPKGLF